MDLRLVMNPFSLLHRVANHVETLIKFFLFNYDIHIEKGSPPYYTM